MTADVVTPGQAAQAVAKAYASPLAAQLPEFRDVPRPGDPRATRALVEERGLNYGHPLDNFERVARIKAALAVMPDDVLRAIADQIAVKLSRLCASPAHEDSWRDVAGYAEAALQVIAERNRRATRPACGA